MPGIIRGRVSLDVESTGLDMWDTEQPVGIALATADQEWYLSFGHREGRQYQPGQVRDWCIDNLAGLDIDMAEAKHDIQLLRKWGLDLEAIGVRPHEVQFKAGLLDDHRRKFGLNQLAGERLDKAKAEIPADEMQARQTDKIHLLPADVVGVYARRDARLTYDVARSYEPDIEKEGLGKVLDLEDALIYSTCYMERQGVNIDVPKLDRWIREVQKAVMDRLTEIKRRTGLRVNPKAPQDLVKLFVYLGKSFGHTLQNNPSFSKEFLAKHAEESDDVRLVYEASQLMSLDSKYLSSYRRELDRDNILRYKLHQLRGDEYGTITGRYSSSGDTKTKRGKNIQQVFKPVKQVKQSPATAPWIIRELFIPPTGRTWGCSDASQIEFRLFAHYSNSDRLIRAYNDNPKMSFHKFVQFEILKERLIYSHTKNFNFMKLYGGGIRKIMEMTGCDEDQAQEWDDQYNDAFPEARRLLNKCSRVAEKRGYVRTYLGRRRRYFPGEKMHSALNSVLQGTAADALKVNLLQVYNERRTLDINLRYTVHDELDFDHDGPGLKRMDDLLAVQKLPFRVPITWETKTGANWKEACS